MVSPTFSAGLTARGIAMLARVVATRPCLVGVCFVSLDILDGIGPKLPNERRHALVDQHEKQSYQQ